MGIKTKMNQFRKDQDKEKQAKEQEITKSFLDRYKEIRIEYQRDFQAIFRFVEGGKGGIVPMLTVIDVTEVLKKEAEEAKAKEVAEGIKEFNKGQVNNKQDEN